MNTHAHGASLSYKPKRGALYSKLKAKDSVLATQKLASSFPYVSRHRRQTGIPIPTFATGAFTHTKEQTMSQTVYVSTDVGGTFTDLVYLSEDENGQQKLITTKAHTTPNNFEQGVLDVLKKGQVDIQTIDIMTHGTTVVINALTERKGAKTALITTQGFRDILEIGRGNRPDFFNLAYQKPTPYIPRYLRFEVEERINAQGEIEHPIHSDSVEAAFALIERENVEAIAICLLNSYTNFEHEKELLERVKARFPHLEVIASHQVCREWREYERTSTTALSAYVQPTAAKYLTQLKQGMDEQAFDGQLYVMQSNCGIDTVEAAKQVPITMVESGPASGIWGAAELGKIINEPNVIALDIGGTTAKCALIDNGNVPISSHYFIERNQTSAGYPIMVPVVDLVEIGNGGGSIAWVDELGKLHSGPHSAGADPGPASYGRGGQNVTTTDANLVLGRVNPKFFCGGELDADMNSVSDAMQPIMRQLSMSEEEVARGIIRIANNNMVNALKLVSINRGHDPRDFTMVAFGGGGAMHACALAAELGIKKVVIPATASVFSAWGMMTSDIRRDRIQTHLAAWQAGSIDSIQHTSQKLHHEMKEMFIEEQFDAEKIHFQLYGRFRYENQEHAIEVALPSSLDPTDIALIKKTFHEQYEKEYTYRLNANIELIGLHLVGTVDIGKIKLSKAHTSGRTLTECIKGERTVDFALDGIHTTTLYNGDLLEPNMHFSGPAIIEQTSTTVVIHPNQHAHVDEYGNLIIQLMEM